MQAQDMLSQLERMLAEAERKMGQVTAEKDAESSFFAMSWTKCSLLEQRLGLTQCKEECRQNYSSCCCEQRLDKKESAT